MKKGGWSDRKLSGPLLVMIKEFGILFLDFRFIACAPMRFHIPCKWLVLPNTLVCTGKPWKTCTVLVLLNPTSTCISVPISGFSYVTRRYVITRLREWLIFRFSFLISYNSRIRMLDTYTLRVLWYHNALGQQKDCDISGLKPWASQKRVVDQTVSPLAPFWSWSRNSESYS